MFRTKTSSSLHGKIPHLTSTTDHNNLNSCNSFSQLFSPSKPIEKYSVNYGKPLLPPKSFKNKDKKTLILDLDQTLIYSYFSIPPSIKPDITIGMFLDNQKHTVYVLTRPGSEQFLYQMSQIFEIVIFTSSLARYAASVIDKMDPHRYCTHRLYREHCFLVNNKYVKDLSNLGRDIKDVIIVDNDPIAFSMNVENGLLIKSWNGDPQDRELFKIIPILESLSKVYDVREHINVICKEKGYNENIFNKLGENKLSKSKSERKLITKDELNKSKPIANNNNKNLTNDNKLNPKPFIPEKKNLHKLNHSADFDNLKKKSNIPTAKEMNELIEYKTDVKEEDKNKGNKLLNPQTGQLNKTMKKFASFTSGSNERKGGYNPNIILNRNNIDVYLKNNKEKIAKIRSRIKENKNDRLMVLKNAITSESNINNTNVESKSIFVINTKKN